MYTYIYISKSNIEDKNEKRIHAQKCTGFVSSMPVSIKVKLRETKNIVLRTLNFY